MIHLRQHVPMFVNDGEGGWKIDAPDLAALLADARVAIYAKNVEPVEREGRVTGWLKDGTGRTITVIHPAPDAQVFHQWSIADRNTLMVEHNHGDHFWVVGYISADDPAELATLPEWKETETARLRREAWNRGVVPKQKTYRCKEHGVEDALCCLPRWRRDEMAPKHGKRKHL